MSPGEVGLGLTLGRLCGLIAAHSVVALALVAGVAAMVGPALLIGLWIMWGRPGWLVLGAIVTLAGFACERIERWSAARREATVAA
jgi:hypothetical protein